ncbi:MAG: diguanylate cyclase [Arcobacter sp.]|jgi:diguanylate cyclase (GGDEF)-like protein|uniref:sensor domain-containing diguanylate cyclase n=1 Tax=Arcobacter sp. TaxID=1872629 RepID=UPI002585FC65|nr:GGDEF domain-containing protein [Arcobacter sp.]MDD3009300.1 diguanylate cyclase [Arcobacter sp.]MDY3204670.1 diguanylate cyclase [Arcobacter sp.]
MQKFLILFLLITFSFANEIKQIDLTQVKWEYKWGDSPFENNIPLWTNDKEDDSSWQKIDFPSNPENRNNQTNVWYRVKLPDVLPNDPNLYIVSIDLIAQVYFENRQIYHFGEFDREGKGEFIGWPWHLIKIPANSAGKYLYFRVYSNYADIGLWGEILLLSKGDVYEKLLNDDLPKIIIGSISIFVSILFLLIFLSKFKRFELLILGLMFLTQGLNVIFSAKILEIYMYYPLLKQYILAIAYFFFPLGMALYMDKTINGKVPFNLIKRIWQVHFIYIFVAVFGSLLGFFALPSTYEFFDIFYNFITLPFLTIFMIYFFFKGNKETKIITFSFFIIALYWIYSSLIASGLVPWEEYPSDVAVFICLLVLSYSMVNKLNYTKELEEAKAELTILSSTDYLTKLDNRKNIDSVLKMNENMYKRYKDNFSVILLDIDDFKKVNDNYGHLVGDNVLIEFAKILTKYTRQTDTVGRWGGEEFIIICPKTNLEETLILAQNLREKIASHNFGIVGTKTVSIGVTTFRENDTITELLSRVDATLYLAKSKGKNRVEMEV